MDSKSWMPILTAQMIEKDERMCTPHVSDPQPTRDSDCHGIDLHIPKLHGKCTHVNDMQLARKSLAVEE